MLSTQGLLQLQEARKKGDRTGGGVMNKKSRAGYRQTDGHSSYAPPWRWGRKAGELNVTEHKGERKGGTKPVT